MRRLLGPRAVASRCAAAGACACLAAALAALAPRGRGSGAWAAGPRPRFISGPSVARRRPQEAGVAGNALAAQRPVLRPPPRRGRVARWFVQPNTIFRPPKETDYSTRWNRVRSRTSSPEEAERVLRDTGRLPRPVRLSDVKLKQAPLKRTVVANATERALIAKTTHVYAVTKLQARLMIHREVHPVWKHERVLVYGKLHAAYLQANPDTNEPMEMEFPLKFKCAFREEDELVLSSSQKAWNDAINNNNMRPDIVDGAVLESTIKEFNPSMQIEEDAFGEAVLDNVLDVGELVFQHFACNLNEQDKSAAARKQKGKDGRLWKRMGKRVRAEYGVDVGIDIMDPPEDIVYPKPQEVQDDLASGKNDDVKFVTYTKKR